jgi:hypothetical protein
MLLPQGRETGGQTTPHGRHLRPHELICGRIGHCLLRDDRSIKHWRSELVIRVSSRLLLPVPMVAVK